jgi:glycosyltransferase involved in cell wall biosynthesis
MDRFVFFTSLPEVGGHTTITVGLLRLVRGWFGRVLVVVKEMPGHGTSASALEALAGMGVETMVLNGKAGLPRVLQWAGLVRWRRPAVFLAMGMRHLSPVLALLLGARQSFYYHITHDLGGRVGGMLRSYARFFTAIGFISPATERIWGAREGRGVRTFSVTQPIDWEPGEPVRIPDEGPPRFGFIGRLNEGKGCGILVRFVETCVVPCSLRVAGAGEYAARFKGLASGGQAVRVRFDGAFPPEERGKYLADFFAEIDYLVVPSQDDLEGIPTVILEALSAGVPAVVTRAGGMEAFDFPEFGCGRSPCLRLVAKEDVEASLFRLAVEPRPEAEVREACRSYFRTRFSEGAVRAVWEKLLRGRMS